MIYYFSFFLSLGYRIQSSSWVNPVLPDNNPLFTGESWVRHQISVTKRKDTENTMVSYFNQGNDDYTHTIREIK